MRTFMRTRLGASFISVLAVASLAACGSNAASSSSPSTAAAAATPAAAVASAEAPAASAAAVADGVAPRTIGYVDQYAAGAMQMRWFNYFKSAADALGWEVILQDALGDPGKGNQQAVALLNQGVDALAISCFDTAPMREALNLAKEKNIPIVQVGCPTPEPEAWSGVFAEDEVALSKNLADYINKQQPNGGETALLFDTQLMAGRLRTETLKSELAKTGTKIVCEQAIDLTDIVGSSRKAAAACLDANPNLVSLISVYDYFAPPAIEAIKSAGREKDVTVYGYYADAFNLPVLLADGSPLKGLSDAPVEQVALVAVDQLVNFFEAGTPFDSSATTTLPIEYTIFTKENAPEYTGVDYITPFPVGTYLAPLVESWKQKFGLK